MKNNKGSATLLTLLIVAVIITIAIGFNWYVREYLRNAEALRKKTEAMLKTYSTFDILNYLILTGVVTNKEIQTQKIENLNISLKDLPLDGRSFNLLYDDVIITLQDTNGLISFSTINEDAFKRLIEQKSNKNPEILIDCYYDWIDTDNFKRVLGAEADNYKKEGYIYSPRNYPLQFKRELLLIKGFDISLYREISPYITQLPISGFNPNTAPKEVLMAVLEIDEATAVKLKDYIENIKPIKNEDELFLVIGKTVILGEEYDFKPSGFYEITIQNREKENVLYEIKTGLRKLGNYFSPYIVTHWIEE
ncbi:MAG: hypothetical protein ABDH16_07865 [Thermodesulfovibrionaceae bacterium]